MAVHEALIGTYTRRSAEGIYNARFDSDSGHLDVTGLALALPNPSYLASAGNCIYAVLEQEQGFVAALVRDGGYLRELNRKPTLGAHPCHVSVAGNHVAAANYSSGSVALFGRLDDGSLGDLCSVEQHAGHGPDERRQAGPHAHMVYPDPWAPRLLVPDLGCDRLYRYDLSGGVLKLEGFIGLPAGAGPRHVVAHPALRGLYYVVNELDNTLALIAPAADGRFAVRQTISTLPATHAGSSATAALRINPDGDHLYATNRGHDSIVTVALADDGGFGNVSHVPTLGDHPRDLTLDPTGGWLLVANQDGDSIAVYPLNNGQPVGDGTIVDVPVPVCVLFPGSNPS